MHEDNKKVAGVFSDNIVSRYGDKYVPKQVIIKEGESKKEVFIILEGEVFVTTKILTGYRIMTTLGPGEIFGEMAFFEDAKRSATIIAKTNVSVLVLTPENFEEVFNQSPEWSLDVIKFLSTRISDTLKRIAALYNN
jgi:membrane protein